MLIFSRWLFLRKKKGFCLKFLEGNQVQQTLEKARDYLQKCYDYNNNNTEDTILNTSMNNNNSPCQKFKP